MTRSDHDQPIVPTKGTSMRITTRGSDSIFSGAVDWVYEEEFGIGPAWKWSPDSRRIAFWQTDDRPLPTVQLTDYEGKLPSWMKVRFP
ncbi:MAG: hypothetical protein FIB01_01360, partial [Gemmatimonadetes bacterium]|nr:hypothetical protein [Gemmatimonadota bacterium]